MTKLSVRLRDFLFLLAAFPLFMLLGAAAWLNHNDDLANAETINVSELTPDETRFGDNINASAESGESSAVCISPGKVDSDESVWYKLTNDKATQRCISIDTFFNTDFDTNLSVWKMGTGPGHPLVPLACDDDTGAGGTSVTDFKIDPGEMCFIRVSGSDAISNTSRAGATSLAQGNFDLLLFDFTPLPVELTAFTVLVEADAVLLQWHTASETDNAGFEVQHALAGTGGEPLWQVLGFVEGQGTTTEPQNYSQRIAGLEPGTHLFRLKQTDFDGTFDYSDQVEAVVDVPEGFYLSTAYPNPFNPSTAFTLTLSTAQHVAITVVDVNGRTVKHLHQGTLSAEIAHTFRFEAGALASGLYLIQVRGDSFDATRPVLLSK